MASIISRALNSASDPYIVPNKSEAAKDYTQVLTGPANKIWRALIVTQRSGRGFDTDTTPTTYKVDEVKNTHTTKTSSLAQLNSSWPPGSRSRSLQTWEEDSTSVSNNRVSAITYQTYGTYDNKIYIVNRATSPASSVMLQNRPTDMSVRPQSNWTAVRAPGRNNPFMIYTGGDDTIVLNISWYVDDIDNREEVLNKCRLLEAWTKADGYNSSPPVLDILWGTSGMFDNDTFILESAPYELSNFQNLANKKYREAKQHDEWGTANNNVSNSIENIKLLPQCATQVLTFRRVSITNRLHTNIVSTEKLENTKNIVIGSTSSNS